MKKLLIHSNNTSFNRTEIFSISEQFVFDVDLDKDVDFYIDEKLTDSELKTQILNADIIFIKVSLSQNYLEFLGIRLAYHIRLTKSLGSKAYTPIVFIAEESFQLLGLTYPEPSILFTGGIYLIKENIEQFNKIIRWFNNGSIKHLEDFNSFIHTINISPPSNYQSHHSIANEWALARYFSMFAKDESNKYYNGLNKKIAELDYLMTLHFKFIEAKASRQKFNPNKHTYSPCIKGIENKRIGIIDDEINKGWLAFYDYLFSKSEAESFPFNDFQKDESSEKLIKRIQNWLLVNFESNNPIDIFIIDLRLHDDDFSEIDFDKLSGVLIIKFIKSINPGIQIIISTASNKVWNYQRCLQYGVNYFAVKESPETYNSREETKSALSHLNSQITDASSKTFLADIYRMVQLLKSENIFLSDATNKQFKDLVFGKNGLIDQILNLLLLNSTSDSVINQCLLLAFQVLENYCDIPSVGSFGYDNSSRVRLSSGYVWLMSGDRKDIFINQQNQKISTWFKLSNGKFDFQTEGSNETPVSFEVFNQMKIVSSYQEGLDASSLVKIISVLYFRDNIDKNTIERIIKLRYYRSNVAAHMTGKIKTDKKINSIDILFMVELFMKIFIK